MSSPTGFTLSVPSPSECTVCFEEKHLCSLPNCSHSFCLECINSLVQPVCPLCRASTTRPNNPFAPTRSSWGVRPTRPSWRSERDQQDFNRIATQMNELGSMTTREEYSRNLQHIIRELHEYSRFHGHFQGRRRRAHHSHSMEDLD